MKAFNPVALFLVAACALSTSSQAAKVYKCGNSYSQVPCADGVELGSPTEPSSQQQKAARKAAEQDAMAAHALEKERLDAEKAAMKEQQTADKARKAQDKAAEKEKTKEAKKLKKEPEFFTAKAAAAKASQPK